MQRFKEMNVYKHVTREEARRSGGKFVNVKWVRINKGTKQDPQVRCRLVAQELAYGRKMDELFAGTPSLTVVKLLLALYTMDPDKQLMILDVKCAFLYGDMDRDIFIELPSRDPMSSSRGMVGKLMKAMYGTRDA